MVFLSASQSCLILVSGRGTSHRKDNINASHNVNSVPSLPKHSPKLTSVNDDLMALHETRLRDVRRHLVEAQRRDSTEVLAMVDTLQRLAVEYHFENEVEDILDEQRLMFSAHGDLHDQALRFRLLRQEGYNVPFDASRCFDVIDGLAKGRPLGRDDTLALASLYEASHMCTEGEDILERIGEIVGHELRTSLNKFTDHDLAEFVRNTLRNPVHKSLPQFTSYGLTNGHSSWSSYGWNRDLHELALSDSSIIKLTYQEEARRVCRWWNELGLEKELKFARHQPLKWYMWTMAAIGHPRLSVERVELTKPISLIYVIDDIFDVYGTLDDLIKFTNSIVRWSPDENLPNYMKVCFHVLDNITNEISSEVYWRHGWNPITFLRKSWGRLVEAFLVEARWFANKTYPTTDNYLRNAIVSSGVHVALVHAFILQGKGVTKQSVDSLDGFPGIVSSSATILRLWDDLGSAKDENQDGHDGSYMEYYKKEHLGCSDASARAHIEDLIAKEWKKLNRECLIPREFPKSFCKVCLDSARMVPLMYNYDDGHSLPLLKEYMNSMLFKGQAASMTHDMYKP